MFRFLEMINLVNILQR